MGHVSSGDFLAFSGRKRSCRRPVPLIEMLRRPAPVGFYQSCDIILLNLYQPGIDRPEESEMAAKKVTNRPEPKVKYATAKQVEAAAKLALKTHGEAYRALAKR